MLVKKCVVETWRWHTTSFKMFSASFSKLIYREWFIDRLRIFGDFSKDLRFKRTKISWDYLVIKRSSSTNSQNDAENVFPKLKFSIVYCRACLILRLCFFPRRPKDVIIRDDVLMSVSPIRKFIRKTSTKSDGARKQQKILLRVKVKYMTS